MKKQANTQSNNRRELLEQRRNLRSNATPAEAAMWKLLKGKQIMGLQWRRQFSIGPYILDFYCPKLHFVLNLTENHISQPKEWKKTRYEPNGYKRNIISIFSGLRII